MFEFILKNKFLFLFFSVFLFFYASTFHVSAGLNTSLNIPLDYKNLGVTSGIASISENEFWYADPVGCRIVKANISGTILRTIGRCGNGEGEFSGPLGVTVDVTGKVYVADSDNHRIQVLDSNGGYLFEWGTNGSSDGEFDHPSDVKYDSFSNSIFVVDQFNHRIQRFTLEGVYIDEFGGYGNGDSEFDEPTGMDIDSNGKIYVIDTNNHRLQIFNSNYSYVHQFGSEDPGQYEFSFPKHVSVMSNGNIIVTSQNTTRIKIYDATYNLIKNIGSVPNGSLFLPYGVSVTSSDSFYVTDYDYSSIHKFDSNGLYVGSVRNNSLEADHLSNPQDMAMDSTGTMYILQKNSENQIVKYEQDGSYGGSITLPTSNAWFLEISADDEIFVSDDSGQIRVYNLSGGFLDVFGGIGPDPEQFSGPARGMAFSSSGDLYVTDPDRNEVKIFDSTRTYVDSFGSFGSGNGQFDYPQGIAIDSNDYVFVADDHNGRIQKFDSTGNFIDSFGNGMFARIYDVSIDLDDNVWAADRNGNRILKFDNDGNHLFTLGTEGTDYNQFRIVGTVNAKQSTDEVWVVDVSNHRVQKISEGARIKNLISSSDVLKTSDLVSLVHQTHDPFAVGADSIDSGLYFGEYIVSDFNVNLTADRNWDSVMATTIPSASKALLVNLNPVDAPGVSATHSIYIPVEVGQDRVYVCPDASSLYEVTRSCSGGYELQVGDPNLSQIEISGVNYWKIDGLTGTGALGYSITAPAEGMVLNPDTSLVGATQEVLISYTPNGAFIASDRIQFRFENAGFVLANTCSSPTDDANKDSIVDGSASIIGQNVYEYTFDEDINAGPLEFCVNVTAPLTEGSYSVRLTDDNGNFDNALYYVGDDNEVFVTANVAPTLSFNIRDIDDSDDTNVCNFGTVNTSTPIPNYNDEVDVLSECGYSLAIGTNAANGFQTQIIADDFLDSVGTSFADLSNGGTFVPGVEAYGFANITSSSTGRNPVNGLYTESIVRNGNFKMATNTGTNIPISISTMLSYSDGVEYVADIDNSDVTKVVHGIVVGSGTPAGYYDQVITYTTTANF